MIFNKQLKAQESNDNLIMSKLLSNAFKSVRYQLKTPPINYFARSSSQKARCRLSLYSMNTAILDYLLLSKLDENANLYVQNLHKNLVEIICHADPEVLENIENLILNTKLLLEIREKMIASNKKFSFSKRDILESYLINRIHAYHYAINLKMKFFSNSSSKNEVLNLKNYPITKLFCDDSFNNDLGNISEFSTKFSYNIAIKSIQLFSGEVEEIFA